MAIVYGYKSLEDNFPIISNEPVANASLKETRILIDSYECSALESGSTIKFGPLPKGAIILLGSSISTCSDLGGNISLKLGDDDPAGPDDDRYAIIPLLPPPLHDPPESSCGTFQLFSGRGITNLSMHYILSAQAYFTILTGEYDPGSGPSTATGTILTHIYYAV